MWTLTAFVYSYAVVSVGCWITKARFTTVLRVFYAANLFNVFPIIVYEQKMRLGYGIVEDEEEDSAMYR